MVDHLILVIHGIGPNAHFESNTLKLEHTWNKLVKAEFPEHVANARFVPIKWYEPFRERDDFIGRFSSVNLPTLTSLRQLFLSHVVDGALFMNCYSAQTLVSTVSDLLNEAYSKFMELNPTFRGKISLFGHSLGGCLAYDILAHQHSEKASTPTVLSYPAEKPYFEIQYPRLQFSVDHLFVVGSLHGAFMAIRGLTPESYPLPKGVRLYNLFDLYDPLVCTL
jgi:phospholipase DDHD2